MGCYRCHFLHGMGNEGMGWRNRLVGTKMDVCIYADDQRSLQSRPCHNERGFHSIAYSSHPCNFNGIQNNRRGYGGNHVAVYVRPAVGVQLSLKAYGAVSASSAPSIGVFFSGLAMASTLGTRVRTCELTALVGVCVTTRSAHTAATTRGIHYRTISIFRCTVRGSMAYGGCAKEAKTDAYRS